MTLEGKKTWWLKLGAGVYDSWKLHGDVEEIWDELSNLGLGLRCCLVSMVSRLNLVPKEVMWPLGSQVKSLRNFSWSSVPIGIISICHGSSLCFQGYNNTLCNQLSDGSLGHSWVQRKEFKTLRDRHGNNGMSDLIRGLVTKVRENRMEEHKERCILFNDTARDAPVYKIRRFEMIKYSFGQDEEYFAIKERKYDDLTSTNEDACCVYQEIFRSIDEGWMVTSAE
uniref:Uncharacterized protein n=1 Tax=Tanacetum cinerariifolium TaxID=118510 RepID=A0A699HE39_TANCI|nr:hypothetical protein [Tanacetum cinerariifolium]